MKSVREVADLLSVSKSTVIRMIRNKTLSAIRVGNLWRVDPSTIPGFPTHASPVSDLPLPTGKRGS